MLFGNIAKISSYLLKKTTVRQSIIINWLIRKQTNIIQYSRLQNYSPGKRGNLVKVQNFSFSLFLCFHCAKFLFNITIIYYYPLFLSEYVVFINKHPYSIRLHTYVVQCIFGSSCHSSVDNIDNLLLLN